MTQKEARKLLKGLENCTQEVIIGNREICRISNRYAMRAYYKDRSPMDDSGWTYGFRLKWIIDTLTSYGYLTV